MTKYKVVVAARAEDQIRIISEWWSANRPSAPSLFLDELTAAVERLRALPLSGSPYSVPRPRGVLRLLLRQTRHHVYYTVDEQLAVVSVRAVWHAARGAFPPLR